MDRGAELGELRKLRAQADALEAALAASEHAVARPSKGYCMSCQVSAGMMFRRALMGLALAAALVGCDSGDEVDASRPAEFGFQTSLHTSLTQEGKAAYERYCVGCHGVNGDGAGNAAGFLDPKPRNFVRGDFRFSSTRSGELPTDHDLRRTIKEGLRGSAMPAWNLLSDRTVDALVAYVKTFSPKWKDREPTSPIPFIEDPYRSDPDKSKAIARGEAVYHGFAGCWSCHPAYVSEAKLNEYLAAFGNPAREAFRDGLYSSAGKENTQGDMVYPPNFVRDFVRAGSDVEDVYRSVATGITGTAMPTWVDSMEFPGASEGDPPLVQPSDIWAIAYYAQSLILKRPARLTEGSFAVRERPRKIYLHPPPPVAVDEEAAAEDEEEEEVEEEEEE